jgi:hypothetical protein
MAETPVSVDPNTHMPVLPNPGPEIGSFMDGLDTAIRSEVAAGSLSQETIQQMDSAREAHATSIDASATHFGDEYVAEVRVFRDDAIDAAAELKDRLEENHPGFVIESVQSGDVSAVDIVHAVAPVGHDVVTLEHTANAEVLDLKQDALDYARELIEIRSQAEGADPAKIEAQTAQLNVLQDQIDAARDAMEARTAALHAEIDEAASKAEEIDRVSPHPGQTSETGPAIPAGTVADAATINAEYEMNVAADSAHTDHPAEVAYAETSDAHAAANDAPHVDGHSAGASPDVSASGDVA